ncbi:MAG: metal-dependent hydrolase [Chloroflexi bacterium]|nr:metal-dependent hydrolase [Chloroflexota bacterium]
MYPLGHMAAACGTAWLVRKAWRGHALRSRLLMGRIDYRAVAFGSLLPDLVDKPLIWFILRDSDFGGHHAGHSLLFSLALLALGLAAAARGDNRALLIAFGAVTHVAYDSLTHVPWSLLYPFVELDVPHNGILLRAANIAGEAVVLFALVFLLGRPWARERMSQFIREGRLD